MRGKPTWIVIVAVLVIVAAGIIAGKGALLAQPGRAPIQLGYDLSGNLVVTIPTGAPPFQLDPSPGLTVTVPGQPDNSALGGGLTVSFPQGGHVTIPSCRKAIRVTGAGVVVAKRPAGPVR